MKKKNKIDRKKIIVMLLTVILIILVIIYGIIIKHKIQQRNFANKNINTYQNNEKPIFEIEKIILCSSANAIDLSEEKNLQNLSIYQYTDIAVYLKNGEELSNKNTIKELYIDNISLEGVDSIGKKSLTYKNILKFGLKQEILQAKETQDIHFKVLHTNQENQEAEYEEPVFYTDCSNPITLEYLNYDIVTGYKMDENNSVLFDGSILKSAGIKKKDIDCKIKFKINIINNDDEKYSCPINFKIPLSDIFTGTTMKAKNLEGKQYTFFREN